MKSSVIIENVKVYREDETFIHGSIVIQEGVIQRVVEGRSKAPAGYEGIEIINGDGCYAIPGMIDLHFHGCRGYDFCDGTLEAIQQISEYEASIGVTAICPATMTLPVERLEEILSCGAKFKAMQDRGGQKVPGADLVGVNMEGPFISKIKKGAQDERYIIPCDAEIFRRFQKAAEGLVKYIAVAPEEGDSLPFIQELRDEVLISLAHTNADYDTAKAAFGAGACHAVHLFNAMPAFSHREPGVIGAVADSEHVMAELICDGVHIHPAMIRSAFKMLTNEQIIFISDSMRAAGMQDGTYTLGGLEVSVSGKKAVLTSDGALAGSVTSLPDCMRTAVKQMGIPLATAVACVTMNPARSLHIYDQYGSITKGKKGDIVLLEDNLALKAVIKGGKRI